MPAADIVPVAKIIAGHADDIIGPLQHCVVDRDVFAKRKDFSDARGEFFVRERRQAQEISVAVFGR